MIFSDVLVKYVKEKEVVKCLQDLVRARSENPPGEYSEIKRVLLDYMESLGFEVELIGHKPGKENIVGTLKGTVGKPVIMFTTHVDTVPIGDLNSWTVDPLGGELKDGKIWGRGSDDQKCCTASLLMAVKAIQDSGLKLKGDLIIVCTIDEETGYLDDEGNPSGSKYLSKINFWDRADKIVSCVLYNWNFPTASRGVLWLELVTRGVSGHPTGYSSGNKPINPITKMAKIFLAMKDVDRWMTYTPHELVGPASLQWTNKPVVEPDVIQGGFKINVVPNSCRAEVDIRIVPGQTVEGVLKELDKLLIELKKEDPEIVVETRVIDSGDPVVLNINEESGLMRAAREAAKKVLGYEPIYYGKASPMGLVTDYHRKIMFGPRSSGRAHETDEYFTVEELMITAKIYTLMVSEIVGASKD